MEEHIYTFAYQIKGIHGDEFRNEEERKKVKVIVY